MTAPSLQLDPPMATGIVSCADCGTCSNGFSWGFSLMAGQGWAPSDGTAGIQSWVCARCQDRRAQAASRPARKLRVLLVDDDDLMLRTTRRLLERAEPEWYLGDAAAEGEMFHASEFEVTTAGGGQRALELIASCEYDAIVSDVAMPGMRGPDLFYAVCLRWPHLARRFVFMSGNTAGAQPEVRAAARRAGAAEIPPLLEKTSMHHALIPAVRSAASRRAPRSGTFSVVPSIEFAHAAAK